jgi:lipid-A-disaccharide synthase
MRILVSTGEPSGQAIAREVERAMLSRSAGCRFEHLPDGDGGESVLGFWEGARAAPRLRFRMRKAVTATAAARPDAVLLVAFSGFNLPFGRSLRALGVPVVYVAPPQVWAWGKWRTRGLAHAADKVVCLFPFEETLLRKAGIDAEYCGYPLLDVVSATGSRAETLERLGFLQDDRYVAVLPGSRSSEVEHHAPLFIETWQQVARQLPRLKAVVVSPGPVPDMPGIARAPFESRYSVISHAECAVAVSGTVTIESAILGTPMVVSYRLSPFSHLAARLLVHSRYFAMPNILAGRIVVPEKLNPSAEWLAQELVRLLGCGAQQAVRQDLASVKAMLGPHGAMERISDLVLGCARQGVQPA